MSESHPAGLSFQRTNLLVSDLDAALVFYRDTLGFRSGTIERLEAGSYSHQVQEIRGDRPLRTTRLSTDKQSDILSLTEIGEMVPPTLPRRSAIVLHTPDIDRVAEQARATGLLVYEEDHREGDGSERRELGLLDPDGNLVVLRHASDSGR